MSLLQLISVVENSSVAAAVRENDTLFPLIESIHVLAISLVVGSIFAVDLRLLGIAWLSRPVSRVTAGILPLTWCTFTLAVVSGGLLLISNATRYLANGYMVAKLVLIAVAGVNMLAFHLSGVRDQSSWDNDPRPPLKARVAGGLSILLWVAVVTCGRWIGFTMDAQ
jgi:hypothetical protein